MLNYISAYEVMVKFHITPCKVMITHFTVLLIFCVSLCPDIKTDELRDASFGEEKKHST